MVSGQYRILIYFVLLFVLTVNIVLAGTTGKIAGRVVDKETGEPLIGINVVVKGTSLGAASDKDGYYAILSIPPGIHTIIVSMVGYSTVTVNEIRVLIDQTATVNVEMVSQAIEAGIVEVVAERHVVKKDVSSSVSTVQSEELEALPITSINDMVGLQAGVENGFVIRGGNASDMLLNLDGVTQRDPRNNKPISNIALTSIQEVSIEKGGFAAEYGQARSGIVNIVQKEGDISHYSGSINVKYSPPQQKYFGMSEYDPYSMWNRPYMDPAVCWTGTNNGAWSIYTQNQYPKFVGWNAISQQYLQQGIDLSPAACQRLYEYQHRLTPSTNSPDYNIDGSFGGPVPVIGGALGNLRFFTSFIMNREMLLIPLSRPDYKDYDWSIKLNSDINNKTKLLLNASVGKSYNVAINATDNGYYNQAWLTQAPGTYPFWNPTDYLRTPDQIAGITYEQRSSRVYDDSWYCPADVSDFNLGAKLTSMLNVSTYYEISIQNQYRSYLTGPIAARNTAQNYEIVPGYFVDEAPYGYSSQLLSGIGDASLFFGGHSATARDSSKLNTLKIKGDITSQLTKEHLFKAGFEFSYYDLNMNYGTVNPAFSDVDWVKQHFNPYLISAYVQDKIEAYGFIANLGVRMDISNPNTSWVNADADPFNQSFFSAAYNDTIQYAKERVKSDISFSPRLGISHPITESSKLYFNYGHFKEMPAYDEIYRIGRGAAGDMRNYGNPNLPQAQTVSYELGFDQSLFDTYLIQIAAFYNDISSQQAFTFYTSDQKSIAYYAANNNSYSDIRGLELTLRKTSGDWVRGFINYIYQVATSGQFGQVTIADNPAEQAILDNNQTNPLYLLVRQKPVPQPRANASITFLTPNNFGPHFLSDLWGDWSFNIEANWKAGQWITYNPQLATAIQNNVQVTDYFNVNIRLNKTFSFKNFAVTVFMETNNLLNAKRLSGESFYDPSDFNFYMESLHLPQSPAYSNTNIPGNDRVGAYCTDGVYTPILFSGNVNGINTQSSSFDPTVIYYDSPTGRYMNYINGSWSVVPDSKMKKILDNKEYIDMPNNSSFDFLNPRQFFYGINLSFTL
ncbi:MAG: carboxypeptidase-like regulatory domain-containing protein [Bacteroidota bacterium]